MTAAIGLLIDAPTYRVAQIMVRTVRESAVPIEGAILNTAEKAVAFFNDFIFKREECDPEVECFGVLLLDRKNRIKNWQIVTTGTATAALAHPREVYRAACIASASAIICFHNHPSGDPAPSSADVQITHLLREAAKTVDISLLDHVIIGRAGADPSGRGFYSFRDAGLL